MKDGFEVGMVLGINVGVCEGSKEGSYVGDTDGIFVKLGFREILGRDEMVGLPEGTSDGASEGSGGQYPHVYGQALPTSPQ